MLYKDGDLPVEQQVSACDKGLHKDEELEQQASACDKGERRVSWVKNFYIFMLAYAITLSTAITIFDVSVLFMNAEVFSMGTSLLFLVVVLASFFAGGNVDILGPKRGVEMAMLAMFLFFVSLAGSAFAGKSSSWQWVLYLPGGVACGFADAHLGASLGPWADRTTSAVCRAKPELKFEDVSANIFANSAIMKGVIETLLNLMLSAIELGLHWSDPVVVVLYSILCLSSFALMSVVHEPPRAKEDGQQKFSARNEAKKAVAFYREPRAFLLALFPLTLGCASSWKTVGLTTVLQQTVGKEMLGLVLVGQSLSNVIFCKIFEHAIYRIGIDFVVGFGSVASILGPVLYLFTDMAFDGWWIIIFFLDAGILWAVFDTAIKASFLQHFTGDLSAVAFSSMSMQIYLGQVIFYFIGIFNRGSVGSDGGHTSTTTGRPLAVVHPAVHPHREFITDVQAWVIIVLGLMVMPCFIKANQLLKAKDEGSAREIDASSDAVAP